MDIYTCLIGFLWLMSMCGVAHTVFFVRFVLWITKQSFVPAMSRFVRSVSSANAKGSSNAQDAEASDLASINEELDRRAAGVSRDDDVRVFDGDLLKETEIDGDSPETMPMIKKFKHKG